MARDELSVLSAFMAVAEERSFTRAAKQLNISTSGLSHAIRRLEEQIGVRLLTRTTRSVSPTDAGEQLLAHLQPALADIRETLSKLSGLQAKPSGPRTAAVSATRCEVRPGSEARSVRARLPGRAARNHDRRQSCGPRVSRFRRGHPIRRVPCAGHGGRSRLAGSSTSDRCRTRVFRDTPQADSPARRASTSMHRLPSPW